MATDQATFAGIGPTKGLRALTPTILETVFNLEQGLDVGRHLGVLEPLLTKFWAQLAGLISDVQALTIRSQKNKLNPLEALLLILV